MAWITKTVGTPAWCDYNTIGDWLTAAKADATGGNLQQRAYIVGVVETTAFDNYGSWAAGSEIDITAYFGQEPTAEFNTDNKACLCGAPGSIYFLDTTAGEDNYIDISIHDIVIKDSDIVFNYANENTLNCNIYNCVIYRTDQSYTNPSLYFVDTEVDQRSTNVFMSPFKENSVL